MSDERILYGGILAPPGHIDVKPVAHGGFLDLTEAQIVVEFLVAGVHGARRFPEGNVVYQPIVDSESERCVCVRRNSYPMCPKTAARTIVPPASV